MVPGETFVVPKNRYIITLTKTGIECPLVKQFDDEFIEFYKANLHLFKNKNTKTELSKNGEAFLKKIRTGFKKSGIWAKNHKQGTIANEMYLSFTDDRFSSDAFGITCISNPTKTFKIQNKTDCTNIENITLSQMIKEEGPGIYIIIACRNFPKNSPPEAIKLARQISDASEQKSGGGYDDSKYIYYQNYGKRKIRYYKNGNPYIIINNRKKKIT